MNNEQAYNQWAETYDTVINLTRDLEAESIRKILETLSISDANVLELGCGTGKNTQWLLSKAKHLIAADFSAEMLAIAKSHLQAQKVEFVQTDLREPWPFTPGQFNLVTCSLILEHIENLDFIFEQANTVLQPGGLFYIGELHPGKQYAGSKARFDNGQGIFELDCHIHHVSDYLNISRERGFDLLVFEELFDNNNRESIPRVLAMVFKKMN